MVSGGHQGEIMAVAALPHEERAVDDFESVYEAQVDFVWRMLERLGVPRSQLEDATQDVFIVVHRQLKHFRHQSTLRTWVGSIAIRVASDVRRALRRRGALSTLDEADHLVDARSTPLDRVALAEQYALLLRALERLDEQHRVVFVCAELEQMTAPEIAQALQVNLNTVYSRLRHARARFEASVTEFQEGAR